MTQVVLVSNYTVVIVFRWLQFKELPLFVWGSNSFQHFASPSAHSDFISFKYLNKLCVRFNTHIILYCP